MPSGAIFPIYRWAVSYQGTPAAGALLTTALSGTDTPSPVYSDAALTTEHTNPVVADAYGVFPIMYLDALAYRVTVTTSDGTVIFAAQDGIYDFGQTILERLGTVVTLIAGEIIDAEECCYISDGSGGLTAGRAYLADADNTYSSTLPVIVFALADVALGATGQFLLTGALASSGLVAGDSYYVSATPGAITTTAPANERFVGQASSTTQLIATPNPPPAVIPPIPDVPNYLWGLAASVSGNALTVALTTPAGATPSASDSVWLAFRNATVATGDTTLIEVTAAETVVVPDTATLGTSNNVPFKAWIVAFNDAATVRLGIINCANSTSIYPLAGWGIASSTTISTGADSAQVFYSDAGVTSKAYVVLGYVTYESGLATAGTYASAPTRAQVYTADVPLPGRVVQVVRGTTTTQTTSSSSTYADSTLTASITMTSAAHRVLVTAIQQGCGKEASDTELGLQLVRGSTVISEFEVKAGENSAAGTLYIGGCSVTRLDVGASASALTYKTQLKSVQNTGTVYTQGGSSESTIVLEEIAA